MALKTGYSHEDAFDSGFLKVSDLHTVHYYQYGQKEGKPVTQNTNSIIIEIPRSNDQAVIFLHGGPGARGCTKPNTVFFDPVIYRVILLDQRGTGLSTPRGEVRDNTTQALVSDIEALRKHLSIKKWHMVFGGSWGATLSLAYAQAHPENTGSLVLRGVFLGTRAEMECTNLAGDMIWPEVFDRFKGYLPEEKRAFIPAGYHELIMSEDYEVARKAAFEWNRLEMAIAMIQQDCSEEDIDKTLGEDEYSMTYARISRIAQGRLDLVCPPRAAYEINKRLPNCELHWLKNSGHSATEPDILNKLIELCDELGQKDLHL
ncbi:hypothetical protein N0V90_002153 [Kalmusia sp. IMI 367209]|nr:hypothetical protein N0V90_002153 [Kalmusia sp. IMI 367209]